MENKVKVQEKSMNTIYFNIVTIQETVTLMG